MTRKTFAAFTCSAVFVLALVLIGPPVASGQKPRAVSGSVPLLTEAEAVARIDKLIDKLQKAYDRRMQQLATTPYFTLVSHKEAKGSV